MEKKDFLPPISFVVSIINLVVSLPYLVSRGLEAIRNPDVVVIALSILLLAAILIAVIALFNANSRLQRMLSGTALAISVGVILVLIGFLVGKSQSPTPVPTATPMPTAAATPTSMPTPARSLCLNELPNQCSGWQVAEPDNKGNYNLTVINKPNSRMSSYRFDYTVPRLKPDKWSGVGFQCGFLELQNLFDYLYVRVRISFDNKDTTCSFGLKDHDDKVNTVLIGLGVAVSSNITVSVSGNTQTITIPLNQYYNSINRKFIKAIGCFSVSSELQGTHSFTIEDIEFFK